MAFLLVSGFFFRLNVKIFHTIWQIAPIEVEVEAEAEAETTRLTPIFRCPSHKPVFFLRPIPAARRSAREQPVSFSTSHLAV